MALFGLLKITSSMLSLTHDLGRNIVDAVALQSLAKSHLYKGVSVLPFITLLVARNADRKYSIKAPIAKNQELTHG
jgi:hypothetical protein